MIVERITHYSERANVRKEFKENGFVNQYVIAKYLPPKGLRKFRKTLTNMRKVEAIKLNNCGVITYWYSKKIAEKLKKGIK